MIKIIDYGMGNLLSVKNALEMVGADVEICSRPDDLNDAVRLVLPGVGAFRDCIGNLQQRGFVPVLNDLVLGKKIPIMGICLGMQVMAKKGFEQGECDGLGWFDAEVRRLQTINPSHRVPQIGWNTIEYKNNITLFNGLPEHPDFYFVHSYQVICKEADEIVAICEYDGPVTAAIYRDNIFATQFHPEKSQDYGLQILKNFIRWDPYRNA